MALLIFQSAAAGQAKNIRLRNELIETDAATNRAVMPAEMHAATAASGRFLIQVSGPLEPSWRVELRAAGVELIKHVPDDANSTASLRPV